MARPVWHAIAIGTALCAVAAVITGARLTSANAAPEAGLDLWRGLHRGVSTLTALGALGLVFGLNGGIRKWLLAGVLVAALPGGMLEARVAPGWAGLAHGLAASMLTSICAVAALLSSARWAASVAPVTDSGSPSLRSLAKITWVALLVQTALGALYRHQIVGLMPHVSGAMLVMGMVMYAGIAAFSTENVPPAVKRPALALLILTGVQMLFGLGAYLYRVEVQEQATGQAAMLTFTVTHVAVGALTTACCALMGMQITRYVRPAAEQADTGMAVAS